MASTQHTIFAQKAKAIVHDLQDASSYKRPLLLGIGLDHPLHQILLPQLGRERAILQTQRLGKLDELVPGLGLQLRNFHRRLCSQNRIHLFK